MEEEMASSASVSDAVVWIPEDDLLLKNAVEAGASLEALAKGAVRFSRRFTFRELRDRWKSLLYDPVVAAQASARMVELEISSFNSSSRFSRSDLFKGNKSIPEKRKIPSIRGQYYAMRKKFKSELLNSTDLGFLDESDLHDCSGHVPGFQEQVTFVGKSDDRNFMLGNCNPNHFELHEADIDILRNAFPETMSSIAGSVVSSMHNEYHGRTNPVEISHPNGVEGKYGFSENVSTSLQQEGRRSLEHNFEHGEISHPMETSFVKFEECSAVEESIPLEPPGQEHHRNYTFNATKDEPQKISHEFGGKQNLKSSSDASFHLMEFASSQPKLPLWKEMGPFSEPHPPVSWSHGDATHEENICSDNGEKVKQSILPAAEVVITGPSMTVRDNGADVNSSAAPEGEFSDLPDSLLNLSNEDDILLVDVEGKGKMDKPDFDNLDTLLVSSPNVGGGDIGQAEPQTLLASEICHGASSDAINLEPVVTASTVDVDQPNIVQVDVPSTSILDSNSRSFSDTNMTCCTLNTEDPEIPCNDDIFLLIHPSPSFSSSPTQPVITNFKGPSAGGIRKDGKHGANLNVKGKESVPYFTWSQTLGPSIAPETPPVNPLVGRAVKLELSNSQCVDLFREDANKGRGESSQDKCKQASYKVAEGNVSRVELKVKNAPTSCPKMPEYAEADSTRIPIPESLVNPSTSDQEEPQSDDDVPYFSDIEALILEMDLDPQDQEPNLSRQVSRYHSEHSKRTIMRLEQCAQSCLQRAMTFQGAFAILYGRNLPHYIRKTKVILGRSTEDIVVDIDLRREGHANRISRRQAIIKMEADGLFFLKNLGKCSMLVNGKTVATGQWLNLSSSCLIEIRGISFVFEINQKYVRRYLDTIARKAGEMNSKFEWLPEGELRG